MSLQDNDYYKKKASKYFTKYTLLKQVFENMKLKGGAKPEWYHKLINETKLIYNSLTEKSINSSDPKNIIILSGSAALAILLGYENMDLMMNQAFELTSQDSKRPNDLDFIYQGTTKNDNLDIPNISIIINGNIVKYNRKEGAISSPKYLVEEKYNLIKPLIKDFDLTNLNTNYKDTSFVKIPYINIDGINVITPEKLLSFYEDDFLEKNINKIQVLTLFVDNIKSNKLLQIKYSPVINRYIPQVSTRPVNRMIDNQSDIYSPPLKYRTRLFNETDDETYDSPPSKKQSLFD